MGAGINCKQHEGTFRGVGNVLKVDVGVAAQLCTFTKKRLFVHLQWVCFVGYKLHLNKVSNKKYVIYERRDRDKDIREKISRQIMLN